MFAYFDFEYSIYFSEANMSDPFIYKKMDNLNCNYQHPSYYLEKKLLSEIRSGSLEAAYETMDAINSMERAVLSDNPLRSVKNSLIASCTLFTRAALDSNVHPEDAFLQSDIFILKIEKLNNLKELQSFEYEMVKTFIKMINKQQKNTYSLPITKIIRYIHSNITEKITLTDLSEYTSKSCEYLSYEFKKEVGINLTDYINETKAEESKRFLEFSDMSIKDISILFNFCNSGYYGAVFKKHCGLSPMEYRRSKNT